MAVKARDDVTLAALSDVANVRRYYLMQSSTLNPPAAPTANPAPSPWVTAEPTYTEGSTTSLYTVDLTVFTDGTFDYSTVSKSSSYEAAKSAYNKAVAAGTLADSKAKTFTSTPTVPYTLGDLWRNGNKVYICTTARKSGSYTASDWTLTADKTSENTAADTSKVGGTASATVIQNIATALANGKPFIQQATPSATAVGQLWFPTNSSGRVIGMKVSTATGTGSWQDYLMMAGKILVPGSVGTTEIGPDGVTAANIQASNALWAKLASFAKVTTDMLVAGNATITEDLLANVITGIIIRGGLFEAGGGSLPMVRIGPLSGQIGVGDQYGVVISTPNGNANGRALLAVSPAGPYLEFYDGTGKQVLAADKTGVRVINQTSGGMVDISRLAANTSSWSTNDPNFKVQFATSPSGTSPWSSASFFRKQWAGIDIGAVTTVNTPTGKLMIQSGVYIDSPTTVPSASQPGISVQWGIYDQDPTGRAWDQWANNLVGESGRAECNHLIGGMGSRTNGAEIVNLTPNKTYWVAPIYWTANMGAFLTRRIFNLWVSCNPIT